MNETYGRVLFANDANEAKMMPKSTTLSEDVSELNCTLSVIQDKLHVVVRNLFGEDIGCDCNERPPVDCMAYTIRDSLMRAKTINIALESILERL